MEVTWNQSYQEAFDTMKCLVCTDTTLMYFNVYKPITIQVDASREGLGETLLQDSYPVVFVSKALAPAEQCYANIEHKMLVCVFGVEWFHAYVFGHAFTAESNHKPLKQIKLKNLPCAPVCLQGLLLCLQNYDVTIKYQPNKKMLVADSLSHYAPHDTSEILLDIAINHIHITLQRKMEFQASILDDPLLCSLADAILASWLEDTNDVPWLLCPYYAHCDFLTVEYGHILCGEALIIPPTERENVLQAIHEGHLGITKCQYYAQQCVCWPKINSDNKCKIETCVTCHHHCPQEP